MLAPIEIPDDCFTTRLHKVINTDFASNSTSRERGQLNGYQTPTPIILDIKFHNYQDALKKRASASKMIIISLIDFGFIDMALNFYQTSIKRHGIDNFLFVSCSPKACTLLHGEGIPCFMYADYPDSGRESIYLSSEFIKKTNLRTYMILEALYMNFTVLHTDVDIVYMSNPLPDIHKRCFHNGFCDMATLMDGFVTYNAGFNFIRPTESSKRVYEAMKAIAENTKDDDQKALNKAIEEVDKSFFIHVVHLPHKHYQNGKIYYEQGNRSYAEHRTCPSCIVIHNNWIVSKVAKVYRFRELLQWEYEGTDKYYSDKTRKYLQFSNPRYFGEQTTMMELSSLRNALGIGKILNRTVILPNFHKNEHDGCTILDILLLREFDKVFSGMYVEHSFLQNPRVPKEVSHSLSDMFVIDSDTAGSCGEEETMAVTHKRPHDTNHGASDNEIHQWFGHVSTRVLRFTCLYDAFYNFTAHKEHEEFENNIKKAFIPGRYRQY